MDNIDQLLEELKQKRVQPANKVDVKTIEVSTIKKPSMFTFTNILLLLVILGMGYMLFIKESKKDNDNITPVQNVSQQVEKYENLYSTYKGQTYTKLAELVLDSKINTDSQLKENAQAILEKARDKSLGELDKMDNEFFSKIEKFQDSKQKVADYLNEKSKGFTEAGK